MRCKSQCRWASLSLIRSSESPPPAHVAAALAAQLCTKAAQVGSARDLRTSHSKASWAVQSWQTHCDMHTVNEIKAMKPLCCIRVAMKLKDEPILRAVAMSPQGLPRRSFLEALCQQGGER